MEEIISPSSSSSLYQERHSHRATSESRVDQSMSGVHVFQANRTEQSVAEV
jgi:hypothetical protein